MAKQKKPKARPMPRVRDMVADLESRGDEHVPWHQIVGGHYPCVLTEAIEEGEIQITEDGGLILVKEQE